jgi:hypothetical protein
MENKQTFTRRSGKLSIVTGDATKPEGLGEKPIIIPHVVNSIGGWGSGFVLAINKAFGIGPMMAYRDWYALGHGNESTDFAKESMRDRINNDYNNKIICCEGFDDFALGSVQFVRTKPKLVIANMVAQAGTISKPVDDRPPIRYGALAKAMTHVADFNAFRVDSKAEIHCPKFGSDLAGGDFNIIEQLIREIWVDRGLSVTVYEWVG